MAKSSALNVTLGRELDEKLATVATRLDRPESWVIKEAVKEFVELQIAQIAAIEQGIADAKAGRFVAHEDVAGWVDSWGNPDERPIPECE